MVTGEVRDGTLDAGNPYSRIHHGENFSEVEYGSSFARSFG